MDVQSCAECGTQVSSEDIEQGNGGDVGGIFFCEACYAKLQQEEVGPEELPEPEQDESGPKLTLFTIMMGFFILIIVSLVIFIVLIFFKDPEQKQPEPVQETAQKEKTPEQQAETPVSTNEKETENGPAAEAEPPPSESALNKIRNEIAKELDNKAYETVYSKAEKAIQTFKDDTTLKNLHEKARIHLSDRYTALLEEGDILLKGENIKDARSAYEKCKTAVIPEFSKKAEAKLTELDALIEKRKTTKLENEAKKLYLNCSFYFNDFMDEEDAEKKKDIAAEALKHIKQLQDSYSGLEFVKRKAKLLQTMQNILQGKPAAN